MNEIAWWEWSLIAVLFVWLVIETYGDYKKEEPHDKKDTRP